MIRHHLVCGLQVEMPIEAQRNIHAVAFAGRMGVAEKKGDRPVLA